MSDYCSVFILALSIVTSLTGLSAFPVSTFAIASMTFIPSMTSPKTGCFPSRKLLFARLMKNWLLPVFGPAFAIAIVPLLFFCSPLNSSFICGIVLSPYPVPIGSPP